MNEALFYTIKKQMKRTAEALRKNNMEVFCLDRREEVVPLIKTLIKPNDVVATGGSQTLFETGVMDLIGNGDYRHLNRYDPSLSPEGIQKVFRDVFFADCYFSSSNAITEHGELFNVDGNANRVAAITFGPKKVIIVAGYNKIVEDIAAAEQRVKTVAAPANAIRLGCQTPCAQYGKCSDCKSEGRICCTTVIQRYQREAKRITVILVAESFGY